MFSDEANEPFQTPCEKAGWKVGDLGVVVSAFDSRLFKRGALLELAHDDGTDCPAWRPLFGIADENDLDIGYGRGSAYTFFSSVLKIATASKEELAAVAPDVITCLLDERR